MEMGRINEGGRKIADLILGWGGGGWVLGRAETLLLFSCSLLRASNSSFRGVLLDTTMSDWASEMGTVGGF